MMEIKVNGRNHKINANEDDSLLGVLRDELDLTGSKYGCGEGVCGACTVLIDGSAAKSCVTPVGSALGKEIVTIEGLEKGGELHAVQKAFLKVDVFQCAYCAPGMTMSAVSLLAKKPKPTEQEIVSAMQGNICRCGTYNRIVKAIMETANV